MDKQAKLVVYKDRAKKYRWKLIGANGRKVASSGESFSSKTAAVLAAMRVSRVLHDASRRPG